MKPPLTYYGGKQRLAQLIVSLIPNHRLYGEPFFGGGAVFFAKPQSEVEVINDTNGELVNFYKVVKNQFHKLRKEIQTSLHSKRLHFFAEIVFSFPDFFSEVKRAWAVWTLANQSFASILGGTWRCDLKRNSTAKRLDNKRIGFSEVYTQRLELTQMECRDALEVIKIWDSPDTFFYCDPPYFNSVMGHYRGYTAQDFENLLIALSGIKGKFLLSSYPSDLLDQYSKKHNWFVKKIEGLPVSVSLGKQKRKTEVLTGNYEL